MKPGSTKEKLFHEAIEVLKIVETKITDDSNLTWVSFKSSTDFRKEIHSLIARLERQELKAVDDASVLFLPTADFQEHAISNGWSDEYMRLAERFAKVHEAAKGYTG